MKPKLTDLEVICMGESFSNDEEDYTDQTDFVVLEEDVKYINYDSDFGYSDTQYTYIIKHPNYPETWRFVYVHCSWDGGGVQAAEQVVKRPKVIEVWETV